MALHLDLVDLRLFVHVADHNSLTRGAERSHLSLPAASVRIKNLEENIGTKLLYRSSQGVTLTPPGQALAHHARQVLQQLEPVVWTPGATSISSATSEPASRHVTWPSSTGNIAASVQLVLRALQFVDVHAGGEPADDVAGLVAQGLGSMQHPLVLAVGSAHARLRDRGALSAVAARARSHCTQVGTATPLV